VNKWASQFRDPGDIINPEIFNLRGIVEKFGDNSGRRAALFAVLRRNGTGNDSLIVPTREEAVMSRG